MAICVENSPIQSFTNTHDLFITSYESLQRRHPPSSKIALKLSINFKSKQIMEEIAKKIIVEVFVTLKKCAN